MFMGDLTRDFDSSAICFLIGCVARLPLTWGGADVRCGGWVSPVSARVSGFPLSVLGLLGFPCQCSGGWVSSVSARVSGFPLSVLGWLGFPCQCSGGWVSPVSVPRTLHAR